MLNKEPTIIINGASELLRQLLPLAVTVGVINMAPDKLNGWQQIISLVLGFVSTVLIRSVVVSTEVANKQIETAIKMPASSTVQQVITEVKSQE